MAPNAVKGRDHKNPTPRLDKEPKKSPAKAGDFIFISYLNSLTKFVNEKVTLLNDSSNFT